MSTVVNRVTEQHLLYFLLFYPVTLHCATFLSIVHLGRKLYVCKMSASVCTRSMPSLLY